jgi:small conductance mechanosensitive channel
MADTLAQDSAITEELTGQFAESYDSVIDKVEGWVNSLILNLPNLIVAVVVFILAYVLSGIIRRYLKRLLKGRIEQDSLRNLIATVTSIVIIAAGLFIALSVLKLDTFLKSLLAGAGVAGLAIGLALQSSLSNTFSGIYLSVKDIMNIGDWVETNGYAGTVHEMNLRNTVIKEPDNNLVMIPNRLVVENPFKNYGLTKQIRVILTCGVAYDSDLQFVEDLAKQAISEHFHEDESKEIEFHWLEFGDSSINFQVRFWIDASVKINILEARSKAIKVIKKAFDQEGIDIPFPIRTLYAPKGFKVNQTTQDGLE